MNAIATDGIREGSQRTATAAVGAANRPDRGRGVDPRRSNGTPPPAPGGPPPPSRPTLRQRAAAFWLRSLFWTSERYPAFVRACRGFFCWFAFRYSHVIRTATLANAARILGPDSTLAERTRLAKGVLRSFYLFCHDVGRSAGMTREQMLARIQSVQGREHYDAARAAGRGAIVVTAHMGSFEVGLASLAARERRVHVVFRRDAFDTFERQRAKVRAILGVREAPIDDGWTIWIGLRDALAADEVVVFQGDRVMPGQKGQRMPVLNGHLELPTGPVRLAQLSGAPIVPVISIRLPDGNVRLFVEPAITVDPARDGAGPDAAMAKIAGVVEKYVRTYPEQWLVFQPAWCEDAGLMRDP